MTAEVVNLRQARKAKARQESERMAAQARALHGRSKAERTAVNVEAERLARRVEQSRRERAQSDDTSTGRESSD